MRNKNPINGSPFIFCRHDFRVTIDGFWVCIWINWTFTDPWLEVIRTVWLIHILQFTRTHTQVFSVCCVSTRYLLTASNGEHPPSSGSPTVPVPQLQQLSTDWLTQSLTNQLKSADSLNSTDWLNSLLTNCPYDISARTAQKTPFLCCCLLSVA
jgi:hypothetical protein